MAETTNKNRHLLKAVLWAALWSTVLTTVITLSIQAHNHCILIVNGASWMWMISVWMWFWILLFLIFGNRGRLILTGLTAFVVFVLFVFANVDRFPVGVAEGRAVMHVRRLSQAAESYRRAHPAEGFPASLPKISRGADTESTERLYKINYTISRSNSSGPIDLFLIQVTPMWRGCGFLRSFAAGEDEAIHFTVEPRPATKSDYPL